MSLSTVVAFDIEHCNLVDITKDAILDPSSSWFDVDSTAKQWTLLCVVFILGTFVVSTLSLNYSQVDKIWSIVPFLYTWLAVCDSRTFLMAAVATIWGVRLTWNFNRRGGYKWPPWGGDEDYRWKYIQDGFFIPILQNKAVWIIFNFGFISLYQNILLLLIVAPSLVAQTVSVHCGASPLNLYDAIATILFLACVVIESIADNQQYNFQTEKYRLRNAKEPLTGEYSDGFKQSGLFAVVRKPNYAAEQATWISFYIFSVASLQGQRFFNWSIIGCVLLVLLFLLSGWFTEKITLSKYPKYKDYMNDVPIYVPKFLNGGNPKKKSS
jgi:steroid 5-alpha reductase family enzyme